MRKLIIGLGLLLATIFILIQYSKFEKVTAVLQRGQLVWILAAFILQALWQIMQAVQFQVIHRLANVRQNLGEILPVVAANNFLLLAAPSAMASTFALFIYDARQRGLSTIRVVLSLFLLAVLQNLARSLLVVVAMTLLIKSNSSTLIFNLSALILILITALFSSAMMLAVYLPEKMQPVILGIIRPINLLAQRFRHRDLIPESTFFKFSNESANDLQNLRRQPLDLWLKTLAITLGEKFMMGLIMTTLFLAFHETPTASIIFIGVATATLFTIISPTPLGIGVAEGIIALVLIQMGITYENATVISLAYRGLTVWLPTLYGFIALQWSGLRWYNQQPVK